MIASVTITAANKAYDLPYKLTIPQDLWITVIDPEEEFKVKSLTRRLKEKKHNVKHFAQYFYDWSDEDEDPYIVANIESFGPQVWHINSIISFLHDFVADDASHHLGVNCLAGISRSTAIGVIAWVMQGKPPMEALEEILKVRPEAWPNLRILKFASQRLGVDIYAPIKNWKEKLKSRIYSK
jgi:predicted protein tyrosine phosphatase